MRGNTSHEILSSQDISVVHGNFVNTNDIRQNTGTQPTLCQMQLIKWK